MKIFVIWLGIFFGVIAVIGLIFFSSVIGINNSIINKKTIVENNRAQIEAQLQRRADLVPNIVATTKGAMKQEKDVFENISNAYGAYMKAQSGTPEKYDTGTQLGAALRGYLVVVQQYPNLRSLDLVKDLNTVLEGSENRISVARQDYNDSVRDYNYAIRSFPGSVVAGFRGFQEEKPYQAEQSSQKAPKVEL